MSERSRGTERRFVSFAITLKPGNPATSRLMTFPQLAQRFKDVQSELQWLDGQFLELKSGKETPVSVT